MNSIKFALAVLVVITAIAGACAAVVGMVIGLIAWRTHWWMLPLGVFSFVACLATAHRFVEKYQ